MFGPRKVASLEWIDPGGVYSHLGLDISVDLVKAAFEIP